MGLVLQSSLDQGVLVMDLRREWLGYAAGLLLLAAAIAARALFGQGLGDDDPFLTFFFAVGLAALVGPGAALLVGLGGLLAADLLILAPLGSLWIARPADTAAAAAYLFVSGLLVMLAVAVRRHRQGRERAEIRMEELFAVSPVGLALVDDAGRVYAANPAALAMAGYTRAELEADAVRWDRLTPPAYAALDAEAVRQVRETGRCEPYEKELCSKSGECIPVLVGARRVEARGRGFVAATFVTDLRPLKSARLALQQSESRHRHLFETMEQGVVYQDAQGRIIDVNPAAERILGLSAAQMTGRDSVDPRWKALRADGSEFPGEEHPSLVALRTGKRLTGTVMGVFNPVRRAYRWISIDANPLVPCGDAHPECVYTLFADITAQRETETALRRQTELLVEAAAKKNRFLALLAHELRNPIAAIQNAVNIVRLAPTTDAGDARRGDTGAAMRMAARQLTHLRRLVDDLLDISRIDRGRFSLEKSPTSVQEVVRNALEAASPRIEQRRHELAVDMPDEPLPLYGDPVRLSQALSNLLVNAAKYTEARGAIGLAVRREGETVSIAVSDTGRGISRELLPTLFEPFEGQGESPGADGLGLGLSLARSIAQLHGGTIAADSPGVGMGATFTLRLPLADADPGRGDAAEPAPLPGRLAGMRFLVVDDNRDAADSTTMLLSGLGALATAVYDGEAALRAAEAARPDVVLLDIGMPGMDGYQVAARLRERVPPGAMLLIALSGWADRESRRRSRAAGFDYHLAKPLELAQLARVLPRVAG